MRLHRLHIGCGNHIKKGFVNIDFFNENADLKAQAHKLPFKQRSATRIESYQLIEHLGYINCIYALSEWYFVLKKGGKLIIETPDVDKSFKKYLASTSDQDKIRMLLWIYGNELPGYYHKFCFSKKILRQLLKSIGFKKIKFKPQTTYRQYPGLRVECVKDKKDCAIFEVLAVLRKKFLKKGLVVIDDLKILEIEDKFDHLKKEASPKTIFKEFSSDPEMMNEIFSEFKKNKLI